ncbi:hypothetical protein MYE70_00640 [Marinobacter alexandrii]|uniref:hypothetical protein n=1 Tax=Marinobacter alexandrii TaxID=2570351 RepID=UPI001FFF7382|nr:hypothetical protein [Marinobacter alexandrii]MCK2147564.1 hypothetical protein [Marinobacter alexandrii]
MGLILTCFLIAFFFGQITGLYRGVGTTIVVTFIFIGILILVTQLTTSAKEKEQGEIRDEIDRKDQENIKKGKPGFKIRR